MEESVYKHLVSTDGEDAAKKLVHYMHSYLQLGHRVKIDKWFIFDLKQAIPMIGPQAALDELAYFTRQSYTFEQFIEEVEESQYDNIILDFEQWDNRPADTKFYEVASRCLKQ